MKKENKQKQLTTQEIKAIFDWINEIRKQGRQILKRSKEMWQELDQKYGK